MKVFVQEDYKKFVDANHFEIANQYKVDSPSFSESECQSIVGSADFILSHLRSSKTISRILIVQNDGVSAELMRKLQPTHVLQENNLQMINVNLGLDQSRFEKQRHVEKIKKSVETKREELEKLNSFLIGQSDEKMSALRLFHQEENLKKNREKKLLYFLDFLNSEYERADFLSILLQYLWLELKKIGPFYQLGFIVQTAIDDYKVIVFDGRQDHIKSGIKLPEVGQDLAKSLANLYKRPVNKIISWQAQEAKNTFFLFLESQGKEYDSVELESFISDRLNLISIVTHRWFIEVREKYLLDQWNKTFKAYKDPLHVVDELFNLIQTNYATPPPTEIGRYKCYQLLAGLEQPCVGCPLLTAQPAEVHGKVLIREKNYRTLVSPFKIESTADKNAKQKKYFFVFYEDTDDIDRLKSDVIQSEKMMTIGQLANHLAHELNNPLTGLKLYSQFLLQNGSLKSSTNLQSDVQEILKAVERSETIIKDLIEFSAETNGDATVKTEIVVFDEVLKKTMTLLKSITRNHRLFIDLKRKQVRANSAYLQQVIFNIIKNACQAIPDKGSIKIFEIENEQYIDYIIEDDGPGLPPAIIQHVFKPFFTTKKESEGTGLGLYISRTLMKRMEAELLYDSQFKQGARFILRFKK